jgi:oxygen-independent coproporphyrinogen-3 oxidase
VQKEITLYARELGDSVQVKSIYFGGGTPTVLPARELTGILNTLYASFPVTNDVEVTVECNPGTVDGDYFLRLKDAGVNRLSIGAQAAQDRLLEKMGRIHCWRDTVRTLSQARRTGLENINLDLIYGLPGQTIEQWKESLRDTLSLEVPHVAVYGLKLELDTPWGQARELGKLDFPDQDISADMLEAAMDFLMGAGYLHYEISNFARPGFPSRHNIVYWKNHDYLGIGAAAASHLGPTRRTNVLSVEGYIDALRQGCFPVGEEEFLDRETEMAETIFLGLRLLTGIDQDEFRARFEVNLIDKYSAQVEKLCRLGLLKMSGNRIKLSRKGLFLGNEVFLEFLP